MYPFIKYVRKGGDQYNKLYPFIKYVRKGGDQYNKLYPVIKYETQFQASSQEIHLFNLYVFWYYSR